MLVKITRASDWHFSDSREMTTLQELRDFCESCGHSVVVTPATTHPLHAGFDLVVEIYDDYRE